MSPTPRTHLERYAWLSIAAALATITMKTGAWWVTGSVGLLADAAESIVNLVAAVAALVALRVAARAADDNHHFGHSKAEYFSAAIEGAMIFVAASFIIWQSIGRLLDPQPVERAGVGLAISVVASVVNGAVAWVLLRAGRRHRSITLRADGQHLLTDVWTSVGVVVGVLLVVLTGLDWLDPIVALLVGANIIWTGWRLVSESGRGLMDEALDPQVNARIADALARHRTDEVDIHGLRTRGAGHLSFADMHVLVPGAWSVRRAHDTVEEIEHALAEEFDDLTVTIHIEPREDPRAYDDFGDYEVPIQTLPHDPEEPA
ncbi:cation diffusion facilitator family transporter [Janibacter hoylei]|uniref:cation diffusion facilitator family transporter n=1 Tax=Janibacter hoylei TaxID=364298 RepID=UPI0021A8077F|nr:cation diffusion facilitator family transporter [Janibacter hoylei]MCT1617871.1 cation diffusion facilitator family transporter [Janibacter hoylei]MCT2293000.1 cation diffusion facilitator family transporter [Janibacter hoylei]